MSTSLSPFFLQVLNIQRDVIPNLGNFQPMCFGCRFRSWLKSFALSPPLCISISCRIIGQISFSFSQRPPAPAPVVRLLSCFSVRNFAEMRRVNLAAVATEERNGERFNLRARIQSRDYRTFTPFVTAFVRRPQFGQVAFI